MKTIRIAALTAALAFACAASAQDSKKAPEGAPPMSAEQKAMMEAFERMGAVRPEHKQLAYFVGNWNAKTTVWMDPKAPPEVSEGKSHGEAIFGGRYIETRHEGSMMGQPFSGKGVLGFDNLGERYFSTWMDSMSTGVWLAYGSHDAATKTYTFNGSMDDPMKPGTKVPVRAVARIVDPSHYVFEWNETHAGKETKTMQIEYTRL